MVASIDIGGTNTRIALSDKLAKLNKIYRYPTPKKFDDLKKLINHHLQDVDKVIIGIAGLIDRKKLIILETPNIKAIKNSTKAKDLIINKKIKLYLENDAALAGLAESNSKDNKKYKKLAYLTISTGVGGTLIFDKKLLDYSYNFEPGHLVIRQVNNFSDKYDGIFGNYCSGVGFKEIYGIDPKDCKDKKIWLQYSKDLALGIINLAVLWKPDIIIIGGSLTKKSEYFIKSTKQLVNRKLKNEACLIEISKLDDTNVLLGGIVYLNQLN